LASSCRSIVRRHNGSCGTQPTQPRRQQPTRARPTEESRFKRQVIAEGVETPAHSESLLQLDCELVQGYGIARPMPAADLPRWVANFESPAQSR
ncbi:MAG: EAL domain-containing protein, partial [Rhodoferax sp.]|nr:EAL domain-containing protein [Rhodoferax sp.]